jgi:hypothetical protein
MGLKLAREGRRIIKEKTGYGRKPTGRPRGRPKKVKILDVPVEGGNILKKVGKTIKKIVKNPIVKKVISTGLDVAAPIVGKAVGTAVGNPALGVVGVTAARKALKEKTGYGRKNKRAEIVKQVMKEKGLKLGQASKYVKDNGLY